MHTMRMLSTHELQEVSGGTAPNPSLMEASYEYLIGMASAQGKRDNQQQLAVMQDMLDSLKHSHSRSRIVVHK